MLLLPWRARYSSSLAVDYARTLQALDGQSAFCVVENALLFRGTLSWRELITEARVGRVSWEDGGTVHRGFADIYTQMRPEILLAMKTEPIHYFGGHSLGGVMAILAAEDMLRHQLGVPMATYTFGAPRIGDRRFVDSVGRRYPIFRIANEEDLVTRLPPLCRHVGHLVSIKFDAGSILANHGLEGYEAALRGGWHMPQ